MRRPVVILLIVAAALVVAVLALPFFIDANQFRPGIETELTKSLGRQVRIGDLKLGILSGKIAASDLSVADDPAFSQAAFLHAKGLTLSIDLWKALLSRKLDVGEIDIDTPEIILIQNAAGLWNVSSLGTTSAVQTQPVNSSTEPPTLSVKSLKIRDARVSLTQLGGRPQILDQVHVEVKDFAPGSVLPFTLSAKIAGGGDLALEGKAGPIDPANAANTPLTAALKLTNLNLAASGAVAPSSGIDGVVSLDGTATSDGRNLAVAGKLKAEKLRLAAGGTPARNPLLFDVAMTEDLKQHAGQLKRGDVAIGGVKATLTGTWVQQGDTAVLNMVLTAPAVPVSGVVELLPSMNIVLPSGSALEGGTISTRLALAGPSSAMVTTGPVNIRNTRLKGFDLGAKMAPIAALAGLKSGSATDIQTLSTNLRIAGDVTSLQDIQLVLPSLGQLTGAGTIGRGNALDFKMRATVRTGALISTRASSSIPFMIGGSAADPQFRPDVGQIAAEEINRQLKGAKVGGVDVGKTAGDVLQGIFGGKKKK